MKVAGLSTATDTAANGMCAGAQLQEQHSFSVSTDAPNYACGGNGTSANFSRIFNSFPLDPYVAMRGRAVNGNGGAPTQIGAYSALCGAGNNC